MPINPSQSSEIQLYQQQSFAGGINTAVPATEISDNEAVDILNMEYNDDDQLVTRTGTALFSAPSFTYPSRVTSLFYHSDDAGNEYVISTSDTVIYTQAPVGGTMTNITGALSLPTDTYWQWASYGGLAIGVNGSTVPIKVSGADPGTAALLTGTPPTGARWIEVWNDRVWVAGAADPNVLYGSSLGDPEDWTTSGAAGTVALDVDVDDGDRITGLKAFRGSLFIFKRRSIHILSAPTAPATDPDNFILEVYSKEIGCVSGYTIQTLLDDVVFLADEGLASLTASREFGAFSTAILSKQIKEVRKVLKTSDQLSSIVLPEAAQYWLIVPEDLSSTGIATVYVFDYRRIREGLTRWVRFQGQVAGNCAAVVYNSGIRFYVIGGTDGTSFLSFSYFPKDPDQNGYTDEADGSSTPYTKNITTKAYSLGAPLIRKLFHKWGLSTELASPTYQLSVQYYYDQQPDKGGTYGLALSGAIGDSAIWDLSLWDTAEWDSTVTLPVNVWRAFLRNASGSKGANVTFSFSNSQEGEGLIIKNFALEYAYLHEDKVSSI